MPFGLSPGHSADLFYCSCCFGRRHPIRLLRLGTRAAENSPPDDSDQIPKHKRITSAPARTLTTLAAQIATIQSKRRQADASSPSIIATGISLASKYPVGPARVD